MAELVEPCLGKGSARLQCFRSIVSLPPISSHIDQWLHYITSFSIRRRDYYYYYEHSAAIMAPQRAALADGRHNCWLAGHLFSPLPLSCHFSLHLLWWTVCWTQSDTSTLTLGSPLHATILSILSQLCTHTYTDNQAIGNHLAWYLALSLAIDLATGRHTHTRSCFNYWMPLCLPVREGRGRKTVCPVHLSPFGAGHSLAVVDVRTFLCHSYTALCALIRL